jgi:predicted aspartyl protease
VCLVRKRDRAGNSKKSSSSRGAAAANFLDESADSDLSRRMGKSQDECPRATITINGQEILHVLDTGANINILTRKTFESLSFKPALSKYRRHLYAYHT